MNGSGVVNRQGTGEAEHLGLTRGVSTPALRLTLLL